MHMNYPKCHDEELLVLKATSQAALHTMESALNILLDLRDVQGSKQGVHHQQLARRVSSPLSLSPKKKYQELKGGSPNMSACQSPTKMQQDPPALDSLSVKSVMEAGTGAAGSKFQDPGSSLSASTSRIDQAGGAGAGKSS